MTVRITQIFLEVITSESDGLPSGGIEGILYAIEGGIDTFQAVGDFKGYMIVEEFPNIDTFIGLGAGNYIGDMLVVENQDTFSASGEIKAKPRRIQSVVVVGY